MVKYRSVALLRLKLMTPMANMFLVEVSKVRVVGVGSKELTFSANQVILSLRTSLRAFPEKK